jgi:hypothetical protein
MKPCSFYDFEWQVDSAGYEIVERSRIIDTPLDKEKFIVALHQALDEATKARIAKKVDGMIRDASEINLGKSTWILRKGGPLRTIRPLDCPALYRYFAKATTPQRLLEFIAQFGMPDYPDQQELDLARIIDIPEGFKLMVAAADCEDWQTTAKVFEVSVNYMNADHDLGMLVPALTPSAEKTRPTLSLHPRSLIAAMNLQFAADIARNAQIRECPQCGTFFEYGPGTGRRSSAIYCREKCRNAAFYVKRKTVQVATSLVGEGEHYSLEVDNDAMIEAGIFKGDTVIIKKTDEAQEGDIVVAAVDGFDPMLRRIQFMGVKTVILAAAHAGMEPINVERERFTINGLLVGLMAKYSSGMRNALERLGAETEEGEANSPHVQAEVAKRTKATRKSHNKLRRKKPAAC